MDRLEESLKCALARKDAPPGFAGRVAARATGRRTARSAAPRWLAAAAAIVSVVVGSGVAYRRHQGEVAKDQVMQAMKITAVKLHRIQVHVQEVRQ
jgi:hypothetical protein